MSHPARNVLRMSDLQVETVSGVPVSFVRDGRTWHVAVSVRWFERVDWWKTSSRMPQGGPTRMDVVVWQVQARIGHNPKTPLVTFELVLGQDRETWVERSMVAIAA